MQIRKLLICSEPRNEIENGVNKNPTIETLTKIAKALEVGVDDLIK